MTDKQRDSFYKLLETMREERKAAEIAGVGWKQGPYDAIFHDELPKEDYMYKGKLMAIYLVNGEVTPLRPEDGRPSIYLCAVPEDKPPPYLSSEEKNN